MEKLRALPDANELSLSMFWESKTIYITNEKKKNMMLIKNEPLIKHN